MPRGAGSLRRLPSGVWQARYRDAFGQRQTAPHTFATREAALNWLDDQATDRRRGAWVDPAGGRVLLDDYAARWVDTRRNRKGEPLRATTAALYRDLLRLHVAPALGGVALGDLTPEAVRAWHAGLPGATVPAKCYRLLRAVLATAVDDGLIYRNPCKVVGGGAEASPERPIPTVPEVWALAGAVDGRWRALVLTAAFCSLRWGELVYLRRRHVDLLHGTIRVEGSVAEVGGRLVEQAPKSDAGVRTVAVPAVLAAELEAHLASYAEPGPDGRVFVGAKGATPRRANFSPVWDRARRQVGRPDLHLHDLRHAGATWAAQAGATTAELMARIGHSSPRAALRYQHATAERDRALAGRLDGLLREEAKAGQEGGQVVALAAAAAMPAGRRGRDRGTIGARTPSG
ncbi:MAG: site-specific integrase [Acidimicrobiales bacterium]|nr:site-specific integrase [Acidimicrobiales bacterium]